MADGDALLEPGVTRRLIEAYVTGQRAPAQAATAGYALPSALPPRELEILRLIAVGWTNNEIADHLFISPLTCKSHVSRILLKLEARDRRLAGHRAGSSHAGRLADPADGGRVRGVRVRFLGPLSHVARL